MSTGITSSPENNKRGISGVLKHIYAHNFFFLLRAPREVPKSARESLCGKCLHLPHVSACVITHKDALGVGGAGWGGREVWPQRDNESF